MIREISHGLIALAQVIVTGGERGSEENAEDEER